MDLSALESSVKALETSLDSVEGWITISTVLVVVGLVIEYWLPLRELIMEMRKRPPFPWKLLMEMVGGVLVTVGVAGELWFQSRTSSLQTFIRSDSHQIEALLNKEAGLARKDAADADKDAGAAKERAEKLGLQAATLRKQAEDERIARVQLEKSVQWRYLSKAQERALCTALPDLPSISILVPAPVMNPYGDAEAQGYALELMNASRRCAPEAIPKIRCCGNAALLTADRHIVFGLWLRFEGKEGEKLAVSVRRTFQKLGIDVTGITPGGDGNALVQLYVGPRVPPGAEVLKDMTPMTTP